jgi:hypothetical protein
LSVISGQPTGTLSGLHIFDENWATVVWRIKRTDANEYTLAMSVNGGAEQTWVHDSGGGMTDTFDTFIVFSTSGAEFSIDNVTVDKQPDPPSLKLLIITSN